jgi:hypothetical protein
VQSWCERGFIPKGHELLLFVEARRRGLSVDPVALDVQDMQLQATMIDLQAGRTT